MPRLHAEFIEVDKQLVPWATVTETHPLELCSVAIHNTMQVYGYVVT